jgi:hypothetical protein
MLKKLILVAAGLVLSAPVLADRGHYKHHWKHQRHYQHHYSRPVVIMPAPRVYYAPPAPVYYAPAPVYRAPLPHSGVSIRLHFPL